MLDVFFCAFFIEVRHLASQDKAFQCPMEHPIDSEPMSADSLHSGGLVTWSLVGIENDGLGLLVALYFAYSAKLSKAAIAALHLLYYAEELALRDTCAFGVG